jgi:hypothetical protein
MLRGKMQTFYITTGLLALASLALGQSSAPAAGPVVAKTDGRVSNSHIHLFTKDPEVQRTSGWR